MKRVGLGAAGLVVLAALLVWIALPPRSIQLAPAGSQPVANVIAGTFHVHTNRSDGAGTIDEVAAAASRAGLQFLILTDHGDGTRPPDAPAYRSGVLVLDGVEISTSGGHYAVAGMPQSPYPLAGEPRDVVEDVRRLNGFGVIAHGGSAKPDLRWTDWSVPFDSFEWLNLDSEWRDESSIRLATRFLLYPFRKPEVLLSLTSRPVETLERWDAMSPRRRLVALAATDAHAQLVWRTGEVERLSLKLPSYEACFRILTTRLELQSPLTGHAARDAETVLAALRAGHHYTVLDALATPPAFEFRGRVGEAMARQGDTLPEGESIALIVRLPGPAGATIVLLRNGKEIDSTTNARLTYLTVGTPAVYRVEVRLPNAPGSPPVPWIVSNAIYVGVPPVETPPPLRQATETINLLDPATGSPWTHEQDRSSTAEVIPDASGALTFRYALGAGRPSNQFAALVKPVEQGLSRCDRLVLRARASRPLRLSVQLRATGSSDPQRWQRSVYLDSTPRTATVFFDDMHPVGNDAAGAAPLPAIGSLMLLLDMNQSAPGTSGEVVFSELSCAR